MPALIGRAFCQSGALQIQGVEDLAVLGSDGYLYYQWTHHQWGTRVASSGSTTTITLPLCFPHAIFSATGSLSVSGYAGTAYERILLVQPTVLFHLLHTMGWQYFLHGVWLLNYLYIHNAPA